jgi:hypothetical protein
VKKVRELGSERRETVRSLSAVGKKIKTMLLVREDQSVLTNSVLVVRTTSMPSSHVNEPRVHDVYICDGAVHVFPRSQAGQVVQRASTSVKLASSCRIAAEPTPMGGNKLQTFSVVENAVHSTGFLHRGRHQEVL